MSTMMSDEVLASLIGEIESRIEEPAEGGPPIEALESLRDDLPKLGLFGLLIALPDTEAPDATVAAEGLDAVRGRFLKAMREDDAEPDLTNAPPLAEVLATYVEKKGSTVARKTFQNAIFEFYELQEHGLFVDDVEKAYDVIRTTRGETDDVKSFIRRAARLSTTTAKFILGLFPEQIQLIHRLSQRQAEWHEVDQAFDAFGPNAIRLRLFPVISTLLEKELRFRLALTMWARLRGVTLTRAVAQSNTEWIELKSFDKLIARALEREDARKRLIEVIEAYPVAHELERLS